MGSFLKILLISDDLYILKLYTKVFEKYGNKVITALTPAQGLKLIEDALEEEPFNLVYMDYACFGFTSQEWEGRFLKLDESLTLAGLPSGFIHEIRSFFQKFAELPPEDDTNSDL